MQLQPQSWSRVLALCCEHFRAIARVSWLQR